MWSKVRVIFENAEFVDIEDVEDINIDDNNLLHLKDVYGDEVAVFSMNNIAGYYKV